MLFSQLDENVQELLQRVEPVVAPAPVQTPSSPPASVPTPAPLPASDVPVPLPTPVEGEDGLSQPVPPAEDEEQAQQSDQGQEQQQEQEKPDAVEKPPKEPVEDGIPGKHIFDCFYFPKGLQYHTNVFSYPITLFLPNNNNFTWSLSVQVLMQYSYIYMKREG